MPSYSSDDAAAMSRVLHHLEKHPEEIHNAELEALQAFVTSLGGRLPPKPTASSPPKPTASSPPKAAAAQADEDAHDPEKWEEDFLDHSHDVRPNADANPSEADEERAMELKGEAQDAASDGNLSEAIAKMTQALTLTPNKAMYWALRADYFLQNKKPNAAIADATKALSLNNENARAHRVRGTAYRHLCRWEESALDLNAAQRVDFNESVDALLKVVQPKANHARDRKRKQELDEQNARQEALRRQRERELEEQREEEARKHAESSSSFPGAGGAAGGFPGGMPPRGGMPGGMPGGFPGGMPPGADQLFSDPEIMAAMQDPDTAAKLQMMMQNPAMAMQFMNDPKVGPVIQKIMAKMMGGGAGGGMPGGFPGGMPGGFPGGMPGGFPGGMGGGGAPPRGGGFSSSAGPRGAAQSSYQSSAQQQRPSSNAKPAADDLD